ncbi:hypothetical protein [Rummeliibacillus suwonensis]|uniref:hypothetical protein n=1 Tax=Rummeliibacillus suwonensis TaxID=1306154 RepID=UPI00289CEAA5|nr:hypothetical protein [Rummeliibacillus suwonensis]
MLIFKKIEDAVRMVKQDVAILGVQTNTDHTAEKLKLLQSIIAYVNSYEWLSHETSRKKLKAFLQSRYNYEMVAAEFNVSVKSLYVTVSYASDRLEKRIGTKTIDLILADDLETAEREFLLGTGKYTPTNLFISGMVEALNPPVKDSGVDFSTCERELKFLSSITKKRFNQIVKQLNITKIRHLLYILLQNDSTYLAERSILARCMDGEVDAKEAIRLIQAESIYS